MLLSCATPRVVNIWENKKTGELSMQIMPSKKEFKVAFIPLTPIFIGASIPELITYLKISDENNNVIWEVTAIDKEFGANFINYGKVNTKILTQNYPENGNPNSLEKNKKYIIEFKTAEGSYKKNFLYQYSKIFFSDRDRL